MTLTDARIIKLSSEAKRFSIEISETARCSDGHH
jgi:hypothetical protein